VRWAPPPGTPPHDVPRPFLQVMRSRDWAWWRPVLGLLLFAVVYTVAAVVIVLPVVVTGVVPDLAVTDLANPTVLLVTNLTLIVAIPSVWLAWVVAHGMRMGWSASVVAHLRRRLFVPFAVRALLTIGVGIAVSVVLGWLADPASVQGPVRDLGWVLVVVLLTTPLQSAAEEYFFRGYLSQALAGWIRSPRAGAVVAAVLSAALFSAAHAPGDLLAFLDRFGFGLAASATAWLTGGLEAAIVLHAVNNVLVFLLAGLLGQGLADDTASGPGLLFLAVDLLSMGGYVWLVARARHRLRPETRTAALDLSGGPAPLGGPAVPGAVVPWPAPSGIVVPGVAPPWGSGAPRHPWGMG
jgi:membrane protease YdiL (CAAX protease family)